MENVQGLLQDLIDNNIDFNKIGRKRKIIFWFNEKGVNEESREEVEKIKLKEAELLIYDNNSFYIRYHIEKEKPNQNFVIFFPNGKQNLSDNPLLDLYTKNMDLEFSLNKISKIINELKLDTSCREIIEENYKFFKGSKRVEAFAKFEQEKNKNNIQYIITTCLLGIKTIQIEEIIKNILIEYLENSKKYEELVKYGNKKFVINLLNEYFGAEIKKYEDLPTLMNSIILTFFESNSYVDKINRVYNSFILSKKNSVNIFVDQLMRDDKTKVYFESLSKKAEKELGIEEMIKDEEIDKFINSEAFVSIDEIIIDFVVDQLQHKIGEYEKYVKYIQIRESKYWYKELKNEYKFLKKAISFYQKEEEYINSIRETNIDEFAKNYVTKLYKLDTIYRKISYYYEHIKNKDKFAKIKEYIEKVYVNKYMSELSTKWSSAIEKMRSYSDVKMTMQNKFYTTYIKPLNEKKGRTIVIVSDALRYEIAKELNIKLRDITLNSKVEYMWGLVPSYTKLGMAALLPNKELKREKNEIDILVDGVKSLTAKDREFILQKENPDSIVIQYSDFKMMKKTQWQKLFSGKKVIYIYHDRIDNAGEHDESNLFNECQNTVNELSDLVEDLHTTFGGINLFITADHGFFFRNGIIEKAGIIEKGERSTTSKLRFEYSKERIEKEGILSINLDYIFGKDSGYVNVPKGDIIYSIQGGGRNYFHGGVLPQEVIIPVIDFKSTRNSNGESEKVEIVYSGNENKISNVVTYLDFLQTKKVDSTHRPCRYIVRFEDEYENKISDESIIIANYEDDVVRNRSFREKFVFKDMQYDDEKKYYLVIINEKTGAVLSKTEFKININ